MTRVAIIGAGPSGLGQLRAFAAVRDAGGAIPEVACFEKQADWGGPVGIHLAHRARSAWRAGAFLDVPLSVVERPQGMPRIRRLLLRRAFRPVHPVVPAPRRASRLHHRARREIQRARLDPLRDRRAPGRAGRRAVPRGVRTSALALQGPRARDILAAVLWTPPARAAAAELGWFRFTVGRIGGPGGLPVVVSRTGYTGELGYELFCHPRDAERLWDAPTEAGAPHSLAPMGLDALDILRIEAGLVAAGAEFCDRTDPFEAGIGFAVSFRTPDDFIGRAALEERAAHPQRRLVGLHLEGARVPARGDGLFRGRAQVGEITSACRSPALGGVIALARVDAAHALDGTPLEIGRLDGHQERSPAAVVPFPFYDPTKSRVRG